jgi:hypothetical protein
MKEPSADPHAASELVGACHCGKVRVHMPKESAGVIACHCIDCQKLHGNFFAFLAAERSAVRSEGEEHIHWYRSSAANERGFCKECGSRLAKRPSRAIASWSRRASSIAPCRAA